MTLLCKCMDERCRNPHYEDTPVLGASRDDLRYVYGETVSRVTCPECGGELVWTDNGAFCDWDECYVPVAVRDWTDDDVS